MKNLPLTFDHWAELQQATFGLLVVSLNGVAQRSDFTVRRPEPSMKKSAVDGLRHTAAAQGIGCRPRDELAPPSRVEPCRSTCAC